MRIPVLVQETCCQNLNARNTGIQKFCTGIENTNRNTHLLIFWYIENVGTFTSLSDRNTNENTETLCREINNPIKDNYTIYILDT